MRDFSKTVALVLFVLLPFSGFAQSLPAGEEEEEDYRITQLLGRLDSTISFSIRPFYPGRSLKFCDDSLNADLPANRDGIIYQSKKSPIVLKLLPVSWRSQFNSNMPYGWNDGSMIPSRGYQTRFRAGIFAQTGPLSVQFQPEYVYANNADFRVLDLYRGAPDIQPRFGTRAYSAASLGQSSVRLTAGPVSLGLSNENIWWGPGMRNALILSNNAQGFRHFTLNTVRPIRSPVGSFEMQILGGRLESSEYTQLNRNPQFDDWRYLAGLNVNFQPRWFPGLFLGLTRSFQVYGRTLDGFKDYFPFFTPYEKVKDLNQNILGQDAKDQLTSVYGRWLFPKAHAEVYFEYGVNDNAYNFRDFIGSPEHSRSYIAGFRKLVHLNKNGEFIAVTGELTQMQQTIDQIIRPAGDWYYHSQIRQGHTHRGEVLGAGIGPGSNLQSMDLTWHHAHNTIGIQFDRLAHTRYSFDYSNDRRWVDVSAGGLGSWKYGSIYFNGEFQVIRSLNYQWQQANWVPERYYIPENDVWNFHAELGIIYRF